MVYNYKVPFAKVDAQTAGVELARIEQKHDGLTPEDVVDESRDKSAPLHPVFEWNDQVAAEKFRVVQAGTLIRNITVKVEDVPEKPITRAFVNVVPVTQRKGLFRTVTVAMSNDDERNNVLDHALAELNQVKKKYAGLAELAHIFEEIERLTAEKGA